MERIGLLYRLTYILTNLQRKESAPPQIIIQSAPKSSSRGGACGNGRRRVGGLGKEQRWRSDGVCGVPACGPGWAGPEAVECLCWLVRGKPRRPVTGERVSGGVAQPGEVQGTGARGAFLQPARASANVGFCRSCPRAAAPAFGGLSDHRSVSDAPLSVLVPCLRLPANSPGNCIHASVRLAAAALAIGLPFEEYLLLIIVLASRLCGHCFA
ncbi:hypothetical protein PAL_GLEAN10023594 [Pteropus alecto]|uniref:Uncharacterized protein n=1 Tax=Pteropus alecto TaxID=9402 RepID=L5K4X3_PTEAL|nr:hypothetical protein PAL_GLEAN10023594 [Pteropus alecto]